MPTQIAKKGKRRQGEFRTVYWAKRPWLRELHFAVAQSVTALSKTQESVHGFVRGRSVISNAQCHLGARLIRHADLEAFFDSILTVQVAQALLSLGCCRSLADDLARCCTIDGRLRQGTRCAPALANLTAQSLDVNYETLAAAVGCRYSRYADNLTFSGSGVPSFEQIQAVAEGAGFALRQTGSFTQRKGRCQYVTGLTVGHSDHPRLPPRLKRNLRLVLYWIARVGSKAHFGKVGRHPTYRDEQAVLGALRFCHSVEPGFVTRLCRWYPEALREVGWIRPD